MSTPKFTPGPWKPCRSHEDFEGPMFDIDEDDAATYAARPFVRIEAATCAVTAAHDLFEFDAANAYLIAAAPELYEALLLLVDHQNGCPLPKYETQWRKAMADARAALAKARGEA